MKREYFHLGLKYSGDSISVVMSIGSISSSASATLRAPPFRHSFVEMEDMYKNPAVEKNIVQLGCRVLFLEIQQFFYFQPDSLRSD
jgi:hypothetical protein